MSEPAIEPRRPMWAKAEVRWEDQAGTICIASGTLEDTSPSGACVRMRTPVQVGARVTIKWHREQFSAVAKNCRSEGKEYVLGVRRDGEAMGPEEVLPQNRTPAPAPVPAATDRAHAGAPAISAPAEVPQAADKAVAENEAIIRPAGLAIESGRPDDEVQAESGKRARFSTSGLRKPAESKTPVREATLQEKNTMEPKGIFPKLFGRREVREEPVAKPETPASAVSKHVAEPMVGTKGDLLSYDDIYRAAGILGLRSNYDINKVVEMLHCDRMRGLPEDVRRTSVLMAIETAGASPEDLLRDASARQSALEKYEDAQRKQLDEYEVRKAQENAEIEGEMAGVTAHYAERIKANQDLVARERETLRNWQNAKQGESQRIAEVIDLCSKPAIEEKPAAMAAAAGGHAGTTRTTGPSLLPGGLKGNAN